MKAFVSVAMDQNLVSGLDEWARREGYNRSAAVRRILRDRLFFKAGVSHPAGVSHQGSALLSEPRKAGAVERQGRKGAAA